MSFIHDGFLLNGKIAAPSVRGPRPAAADLRLPQSPPAARHRGRPHVPEPVRDLAGGGSLQVARDARQRSSRAVLHRRRRALREVQGLGRHRAAVPAQPAVSLDPSRAEALFRHRRPARRDDRRARVGARQRAAPVGRSDRARHPEEVRGQGSVHDRRPGGRSREPRPDPRREDRDAGLPDVPAGPGAGRPPARDVQPLDRSPVGRRRRRDRALRRPARRAPQAPPGLPRCGGPGLRPRPVAVPDRGLAASGPRRQPSTRRAPRRRSPPTNRKASPGS